MKRHSPILTAAAVVLLAGALLYLAGFRTPCQAAHTAAAWVVTRQLGAAVVSAAPSRSPVPSAVPADASPAPVPVETVSEAWDEDARQTQPEPAPSEIRLEDAPALELRNSTDYTVDFTQLPALPQGLDFQQDPAIAIIHTHTTESYFNVDAPEVYRSQSEAEGVMAVGDAMAEVLRQRGYHVLHDKTLCDYPEYNGAYSRSRDVIVSDLEQYSSLCLVLDVHRDAVADTDGSQLRLAVPLEGQDTAQVMLVVGTDDGGLEHPDWQENLSLAAVLQARLTQTCPGLMRPINLRSERFNQDLAPLSLLVEVGTSGNTLEEALRGGQYFSQALADVLDQYSGKSS